MAGRRPHKKSRAGCRTCKKRRIKCDEVHPECNNCSTHGLTCDFATLTILPSLSAESRTALMSLSASQKQMQMQRQKQSQSPTNISIISSSSSIASSFSSPGLPEFDTQNSFLLSSFTHPQPSPTALTHQSHKPQRPLESQLLYLWTTHTSKTLTIKSESGIDIWGIIVPTLGLNNAPYLMNAIYSISALHLRYLSSDAEFQSVLARASHSYIVAAISEYRTLLSSAQSTTAGNAEALFVTSSLIAFYSSASRIFPPAESAYEPPLEWFLAYQGVKTIVLSSWKYLRSSPRVLPIILSQPALSLDLDSSSAAGFFDTLLPEHRDGDRETESVYRHSIAFLNWAHRSPQRNILMGFAATVSSHFISLLSARDPRTLVILACFFAMFKVVEHEVWWLAGTSEREVMGILGVLPDDQWRAKLAWAVRVVRCDFPLRDEGVWGCFVREHGEALREETDAGDVRPHIEYLVSMIPAG